MTIHCEKKKSREIPLGKSADHHPLVSLISHQLKRPSLPHLPQRPCLCCRSSSLISASRLPHLSSLQTPLRLPQLPRLPHQLQIILLPHLCISSPSLPLVSLISYLCIRQSSPSAPLLPHTQRQVFSLTSHTHTQASSSPSQISPSQINACTKSSILPQIHVDDEKKAPITAHRRMEGGDNVDKVYWTPEMLHAFCDICITAIELGMRPTTHFDKTGWKFLITTFKERTGQSLTKSQLKNKWDGCKKDWKIWVKLVSETGVGWSSELGTISATNEWWNTKIQECKGAKKFRLAGIEPSLKLKFDRMYSSIMATGEYAWAPSSGVQYGGNCSQPGTNDAVDLEEGSGDSEEDRNVASDPDIARLVGGVNISSSSNTRSSGKRKEMEANEGRMKKKKTASIGAQLMSRWDQLVDSMSSRSDSTSLNMDKPGCSINEVMIEIHSIPGIRDDLDFHDYVVEIMLQRRRREMWAAMGTLEEKYDWLKRLFARTKKN